MATMKFIPLILAVLPWVLVTAAAISSDAKQASYGVTGRLNDEASVMAECWDAMVQLKSCTNEIILFFFNGEAYLGQECCRAIRTILYHCWPSMLTSIGYTAEEVDVLRDYCGATAPVPAVVGVPVA
nr:egg cell-secreted protein 1.4-like [Ipomoea trifida]